MFELRIPGARAPVPVGKILCIGRNYAKHAAEMRSAVPDEPMVFLKPSTALVATGGQIRLPARSTDVHHEVELVAVIGRRGRSIAEKEALDHVAAYAVGLDMTARDLQAAAKASGGPWTLAKGFDSFAPLGPLVDAAGVTDPQSLSLSLHVNGRLAQSGHTSDMIFSVAELVAWCSAAFTLEPGDLLYTGTPEGVGPVKEGDRLVARVDKWPLLEMDVVR